MIELDRVCELFCGAGGMGLGFSQHFEITQAIDISRHVLKGYPDVTRLNALIEAWETELIDCYGYIEFPVRVKRVSEIDAHSVSLSIDTVE